MNESEFERLVDHIWASSAGVLVTLLTVHGYRMDGIAEITAGFMEGRLKAQDTAGFYR